MEGKLRDVIPKLNCVDEWRCEGEESVVVVVDVEDEEVIVFLYNFGVSIIWRGNWELSVILIISLVFRYEAHKIS